MIANSNAEMFSPVGRPLRDVLTQRPRRQPLHGFEPVYSDIVDYILRCTHRIWEEKNVGLCRSHYGRDCLVHTLAGPTEGVEAVMENTLATLAAFPDRTLIGEDVIWSEDQPGLFHTSHRIVSLMTHLGPGAFAPPTGRRARVRTMADCLVRENRIVEEWMARDNGALVRQLGLDPREIALEQAQADLAGDPLRHAWRGHEITRVRDGHGLVMPPPRDHACAGPARALDLAVNQAHLGEAAHVVSEGCEGDWPSGRRWFGRGGWIGAINQLISPLQAPRLVLDYWSATDLPGGETAVALRWSLCGRHVRPGVWGAASDRDLLILGISHYRMRGGRILEDVTVFDDLAILRQIAGGLGE